MFRFLADQYEGKEWDSWDNTTCMVFPKIMSVQKIRKAVQKYAIQQEYSAWFATASGKEAKSTTNILYVEIPSSSYGNPYAEINISKDTDNSDTGKIFIDITCNYIE